MACVLFSAVFARPGGAEPIELPAPTVTEAGEAYLDATRRRGLDQEVTFYDPDQPAPPLESDAEPDAETTPSDPIESTFEVGNVPVMIVAGAILLLLVYLAILWRGNFSVSFARDPADNDGNASRPVRNVTTQQAAPTGLEAILAMPDRKLALVALCKSVLARVMQAQGVLMNKSWTDRDTLRRVPQTFPQRDALRDLIFASERVQFGGRDVTEEEFRAHVARMEPLWKAART